MPRIGVSFFTISVDFVAEKSIGYSGIYEASRMDGYDDVI